MKKLIPLLVIAAGAVAYNVYKNRKETIDDEKTFVVVNDSNDDSNQSGLEPVAEEPVVEESLKEDLAVEESVAEEATVEEFVSEESDVIAEEVENAVESFTEELNEEDPLVDEPVKPVDEIVEAMQELQEELGTFETLSEPDEPFERPSFFHVTEEITSDPEVLTSAIETEQSESDEEVQEEILSTIVIEDDEEELDVEIELFLEEQLDIDEVASFAEEIEEQILSSILFENGEIEVETTEESIEAETAIEPEAEEATIEEDHQEEPVLIVLDESVAEEGDIEVETLIGEDSAEEPMLVVMDEEESNIEEQCEEPELIVLDEEFDETELEQIVENEEDTTIEVESLIEEIAEQVEAAQDEPVEEPVFIDLEEEPEEMEPLQSYNTPEVDELMKTIAGQVKAADQAAEEPEVMEEEPEEIVEEVAQAEESDYLQDIRKITELYSEKVAQYNIRFPYLSSRFIDDTLKFSNQFNTEYPLGTRVAIEHHMHFNAVEDLFVFAQIIRQSGYLVKEGAEDKTLIVVREMFVDNNTILHDVFKVANQVYCLSGEYQKFRITKR